MSFFIKTLLLRCLGLNEFNFYCLNLTFNLLTFLLLIYINIYKFHGLFHRLDSE